MCNEIKDDINILIEFWKIEADNWMKDINAGYERRF